MFTIKTEPKLEVNDEGLKTTVDSESRMLFVGQPIPLFWPDEPALWFVKLEAWFSLMNITSDLSKYEFVRSQLLEREQVSMVQDILFHPPENDKYECIKTRLLQKFAESQEEKINQMNHEEPGDRKPSQFLLRLKDLAGDVVPENFIRAIWRSRLPEEVQRVLNLQPDETLQEMSIKADVAHDLLYIHKPRAASSSTASSESSGLDAKIAELTKKVDALNMHIEKTVELTKKVEALSMDIETLKCANRQSLSRQRSSSSSGKQLIKKVDALALDVEKLKCANRQSRSRQSSSSSGSSEQASSRASSQSSGKERNVCWYHTKFGDNAHYCQTPCDW